MVRLPELNEDYVRKQDYFFLFETGLCDSDNFISYIFVNPLKVIKVHSFNEVEAAFKEIERYSRDHYLAGYFAYELGFFFEQDALKSKSSFAYPLINLCVFDKRFYFDHRNARNNINLRGIFSSPGIKPEFRIDNLKLNISKRQYIGKVRKIKEYIKEGSTYQVNFTAKYNFDFSGSAFALYQDLKLKQNVPYAAFCKIKDEYVISLSPELFLNRDTFKVSSQPMKGTIIRGRNPQEDQKNVRALKNSPKNKAENLMVVDLIRNDLGRVCSTGTIRAKQLFNINKYNTLFQMTSEVSGRLKNGITYLDIFKSIFPGGSVTGAPKIKTMQIIQGLENEPRKIYCGALGIISPGNKAKFNLPIRTISIAGKIGEMGVGSGIVIDSNAQDEFSECLLKAKFLTGLREEFSLLETIAWDRGYKFLNAHLKRMKDSAVYFGFPFYRKTINAVLKKAAKNFSLGSRYRLRILLDKNGKIKIEHKRIDKIDRIKTGYLAISRFKIDPDNVFLYHKTTNRSLYNTQHTYYKSKGYLDVLFLNRRNEFTEGAISNIIIRKASQYYTPPESCGLLPGIYRQHLLKKNKAKEKVLFRKDLKEADQIFICNSVAGIRPAKIKWRGE